jgi:hypothetical protein
MEESIYMQEFFVDELNYWCEQFPDLTRQEVIETLQVFELQQLEQAEA